MDSPTDGHYVTGNALGLLSSIIGNWYCSHTASTSLSKKRTCVWNIVYINETRDMWVYPISAWIFRPHLDPVISLRYQCWLTKQNISIYGPYLQAWVVVVRPNCLGTKVGTLTYSHFSFKYPRLIHTSNSFLQNSDIRARTLNLFSPLIKSYLT